MVTLGKSRPSKLHLKFLIFKFFDAFIKFTAELWVALIFRFLKLETCPLGFKNWAQTLRSGFSIGGVDSMINRSFLYDGLNWDVFGSLLNPYLVYGAYSLWIFYTWKSLQVDECVHTALKGWKNKQYSKLLNIYWGR